MERVSPTLASALALVLKLTLTLALALTIALALTLALALEPSPAYAGELAIKAAAAKTEARVNATLAGMTVKQKVGQVIFARAEKRRELSTVKRRQYGGYLLYGDDFKGSTKTKMKKRIAKLQRASKVNMLIGVDEEGGTVVRASYYKAFRKSRFKSPCELYRKGGYTAVRKDALTKSKFLKSLGINTNLAPVADVPRSKRDYIYDRAFSANAKRTAKYIKTVVAAMNSRKVVGALKHYPGHGKNGDTHGYAVYDKTKLATLKKRDLVPFAQGIRSGAPMVMVGHNVSCAFDRRRPASLSKAVHEYLRNTQRFDGVIVTDSLGMEGVRHFANDDGEIAVMAFLAGNDMLCTSLPDDAYNALLAAVKSGRIPESRLDESVRRILTMKARYGIL